MKCETCKHWGVISEGYDTDSVEVFDTKRCNKAVQLWDAGAWDKETKAYGLKPEYKAQMLFVKDGSDYRADMYTTADFFCAHYEVKT